MIAKEGFDAFKLKDLAIRAEVTVPTIHNLIGGREEVLRHLVESMIERIEQ